MTSLFNYNAYLKMKTRLDLVQLFTFNYKKQQTVVKVLINCDV